MEKLGIKEIVSLNFSCPRLQPLFVLKEFHSHFRLENSTATFISSYFSIFFISVCHFLSRLFELFDFSIQNLKVIIVVTDFTYIGVWNFSRFGRKVFLTRTRPRLVVALHPFWWRVHCKQYWDNLTITCNHRYWCDDLILAKPWLFFTLTKVKNFNLTTLLWNISLQNIFLNSIPSMRKS